MEHDRRTRGWFSSTSQSLRAYVASECPTAAGLRYLTQPPRAPQTLRHNVLSLKRNGIVFDDCKPKKLSGSPSAQLNGKAVLVAGRPAITDDGNGAC